MRTIGSELMELGFSEYEAKVYLSLLRENPATAYEVGKSSGVPTSKVYEVIKKLIEKDSISMIDEGKTKRYAPIDPEEVLNRYKSRTENVVGYLRDKLDAIRGEKEISSIWNITQYDYLIEKASRMIQDTTGTVLVSIWREEFELIEDSLREALRKDVKVVTVHFGFTKSKIGQVYNHPIEDTIYQEKGGRGIVVVADSKEVLMGTVFKFNRVEGAWSRNRGFATLAEDYIKHDIYIMKIIRRYDRRLQAMFGKRYEKLRDIFKDEEVS
jgi:sugar-specific transcriptional regulator TrmB